MFPLQKTTTAEVSAVPHPTGTVVMEMPSVGRHTEKYVMYRVGKKFPPVLEKLVQRGVMVTGVGREALEYSIRWVESKLKRVKS
jgi:hypothetical protein